MRIVKIVVTTSVLAGLAGCAMAQSADELRRSAGAGEVLTHGMGYGLQRFSTLSQINKDTVRRLVPRWAYALGDDRGQEAQPLVRDGVIYFATHNATMAVDALTGRQLWKDMFEYSPEMAKLACCGIANRGAAMQDGVVITGISGGEYGTRGFIDGWNPADGKQARRRPGLDHRQL